MTNKNASIRVAYMLFFCVWLCIYPLIYTGEKQGGGGGGGGGKSMYNFTGEKCNSSSPAFQSYGILFVYSTSVLEEKSANEKNFVEEEEEGRNNVKNYKEYDSSIYNYSNKNKNNKNNNNEENEGEIKKNDDLYMFKSDGTVSSPFPHPFSFPHFSSFCTENDGENTHVKSLSIPPGNDNTLLLYSDSNEQHDESKNNKKTLKRKEIKEEEETLSYTSSLLEESHIPPVFSEETYVKKLINSEEKKEEKEEKKEKEEKEEKNRMSGENAYVKNANVKSSRQEEEEENRYNEYSNTSTFPSSSSSSSSSFCKNFIAKNDTTYEDTFHRLLEEEKKNKKIVILIRHGESVMNEWASNMMSTFDLSKVYKRLFKNKNLNEEQKGNSYPPLRDANLTSKGKKQARNLNKKMKKLINNNTLSIDLLIISPLRRAVRTATLAFKDITSVWEGNKTKKILLPDVTERKITIADIGMRTSKMKKKFKKYFTDCTKEEYDKLFTFMEEKYDDKWWTSNRHLPLCSAKQNAKNMQKKEEKEKEENSEGETNSDWQDEDENDEDYEENIKEEKEEEEKEEEKEEEEYKMNYNNNITREINEEEKRKEKNNITFSYTSKKKEEKIIKITNFPKENKKKKNKNLWKNKKGFVGFFRRFMRLAKNYYSCGEDAYEFNKRINIFKNFLSSRKEEVICIVGHSLFFQKLVGKTIFEIMKNAEMAIYIYDGKKQTFDELPSYYVNASV